MLASRCNKNQLNKELGSIFRLIKDTLKAFSDFKNKQQKCMK